MSNQQLALSFDYPFKDFLSFDFIDHIADPDDTVLSKFTLPKNVEITKDSIDCLEITFSYNGGSFPKIIKYGTNLADTLLSKVLNFQYAPKNPQLTSPFYILNNVFNYKIVYSVNADLGIDVDYYFFVVAEKTVLPKLEKTVKIVSIQNNQSKDQEGATHKVLYSTNANKGLNKELVPMETAGTFVFPTADSVPEYSSNIMRVSTPLKYDIDQEGHIPDHKNTHVALWGESTNWHKIGIRPRDIGVLELFMDDSYENLLKTLKHSAFSISKLSQMSFYLTNHGVIENNKFIASKLWNFYDKNFIEPLFPRLISDDLSCRCLADNKLNTPCESVVRSAEYSHFSLKNKVNSLVNYDDLSKGNFRTAIECLSNLKERILLHKETLKSSPVKLSFYQNSYEEEDGQTKDVLVPQQWCVRNAILYCFQQFTRNIHCLQVELDVNENDIKNIFTKEYIDSIVFTDDDGIIHLRMQMDLSLIAKRGFDNYIFNSFSNKKKVAILKDFLHNTNNLNLSNKIQSLNAYALSLEKYTIPVQEKCIEMMRVRNVRTFEDYCEEMKNISEWAATAPEMVDPISYEWIGRTFGDDKYEIIIPEDSTEVNRWGTEQGHCMSGYGKSVANQQRWVIGVRSTRTGDWIGHASFTPSFKTKDIRVLKHPDKFPPDALANSLKVMKKARLHAQNFGPSQYRGPRNAGVSDYDHALLNQHLRECLEQYCTNILRNFNTDDNAVADSADSGARWV